MGYLGLRVYRIYRMGLRVQDLGFRILDIEGLYGFYVAFFWVKGRGHHA